MATIETTLTELVDQYLSATQQAEYWANQAKAIKEQFASLDPGAHPAGDHTISVRPGNRTLDTKALAAAKPADKFPILYKTVIDPDAAKKYLPPIELDFYKVQATNNVVTIK